MAVLENILWYDKDIYDDKYYKRQLIAKTIERWKPCYQKISVYRYKIYTDDLFGEGMVELMGRDKLPKDILDFIDLYEKYPSTEITLFSPKVMTQCIKACKANKLSINIIPICHSGTNTLIYVESTEPVERADPGGYITKPIDEPESIVDLIDLTMPEKIYSLTDGLERLISGDSL